MLYYVPSINRWRSLICIYWNFTKFITRSSNDIRSVRTRVIFSIPLGILIAFAMQLEMEATNGLIHIYIWWCADACYFNSSLLLRLASVGIRLDRLPAALIAFTLNYAAYLQRFSAGGLIRFKRAVRSGKSLKIHSRSNDSLYRSSRWRRLSCQVSSMKSWALSKILPCIRAWIRPDSGEPYRS